MSKLNTQIYEEASEWIILHRGDDLDADAKRRFDAWLRESPQHLSAYLEMSTIWEDVPTLNHDWNPSADELIARARAETNVFPLAEMVPPSRVPGTGGFAALSETDERTTATYPTTPEPALQSTPVVTVPASNSARFKSLAVAATLLVTIGTAWLYLQQRGIYSTDIGEQRTLALLDGSSVQLNSQTKIRVAYTDEIRTIELLQGQALFKAAKDPNRPFVVESDGTRVRAVGTQFDVYKKSTGTQVTVVEGRVAVFAPTLSGAGDSGVPGQSSAGSSSDSDHSVTVTTSEHDSTAVPKTGDSELLGLSRPRSSADASLTRAPHSQQAQLGEVLLSAGEQILIAQTTAPELAAPDAGTAPRTSKSPNSARPVQAAQAPVAQPANIEAATAWTQQRLVFDFTPLTEVAQEFNRYNRRPLVIVCDDDRPQRAEHRTCLSDFNINGSFSSTDPTVLLRFLREQPGIVVTETTDEIRISREDTHG